MKKPPNIYTLPSYNGLGCQRRGCAAASPSLLWGRKSKRRVTGALKMFLFGLHRIHSGLLCCCSQSGLKINDSCKYKIEAPRECETYCYLYYTKNMAVLTHNFQLCYEWKRKNYGLWNFVKFCKIRSNFSAFYLFFFIPILMNTRNSVALCTLVWEVYIGLCKCKGVYIEIPATDQYKIKRIVDSK
jgi:hypothetical protein